MTAALTPNPKIQFFANDGTPLVGGKLYTYAAGTTTPLASYTTYVGDVANTNPVILDSRGEANVWLSGALYKLALYDADDALIWTVDNVSAVNNGIFSGPVAGTTGTFSGALTAASGAFSGPVSGTTGTFSGAGTFSGLLRVNAGAFTPPVVATQAASAITVNCALSNVFTTTLTANITTLTFSNSNDGQTINWFITQDATGSRTMTWGASVKWPGGTAGVLSTAANAVDLAVLTYRASLGFWYANLTKALA